MQRNKTILLRKKIFLKTFLQKYLSKHSFYKFHFNVCFQKVDFSILVVTAIQAYGVEGGGEEGVDT